MLPWSEYFCVLGRLWDVINIVFFFCYGINVNNISFFLRYVPLERVFPPSAPKPPAASTSGVKQEVKTEVKSEPGTSNGVNGSSSNGAGVKGPLHGMKFTIIGQWNALPIMIQMLTGTVLFVPSFFFFPSCFPFFFFFFFFFFVVFFFFSLLSSNI